MCGDHGGSEETFHASSRYLEPMYSPEDNDSIELAPVIASSSKARPSLDDTDAGLHDHEPLLSGAFSSLARHSDSDCLCRSSPEHISWPFHSPIYSSFFRRRFHFYKATMEKATSSKFKYYARKLAVESEPGLTNAQLMLTNHDLKPGMKYSFKMSVCGVTRLS